ncbi:unnamed protein product [Clavelina lepadiformis]|uniref:Sodium-coupled monocarboxylate transporter 1 n=1 Tax=Clavelina lepadiformis TaxID=159417 RepID=A0ABP0FQ44_CLALP
MSLTIGSHGFHTIDLIIFIGMLVMAALVGIYYAYKDRGRKSIENYNYGGRDVSPVPLGLSIAVTYISAMTVIGFPTESYLYGLVSLWFAFGPVIPNIICCLYYIPLFFRLQLRTVYEYLEYRFNSKVRKVVSFLCIVKLLFYMGIAVYLPALALNAVTPLSLQWTIMLTSGICTFYTTLGGMKAVVWTDTLQSLIMLFGGFAAMVKAIMVVGGLDEMTSALDRGHRLNAWKFDLDPTLQRTAWSYFIGSTFVFNCAACVGQPSAQRFLSCKSVKQARIAALVSVLPTMIFLIVATISGCAAYAYFENCDPRSSGKITKNDQLMAYLVSDVFRDVPGMTGLFISAAFSGTLSTVSSGINSIGSLLLEDFLLPYKPQMKEVTKLTTSKVSAIMFGCLVLCMAFLTEKMNGTVMSIATSLDGSISGPLLGLFTLGIFFPWTNTIGGITGFLVGTTITAWIALSAIMYGRPPDKTGLLTVSIANCSHQTNLTTYLSTQQPFTVADATTIEQESSLKPALYYSLWSISLYYHNALGFGLTLVVGLLMSFLSGPKKPSESDSRLFQPFLDHPCFPQKIRTFFRFGVPNTTPTRYADVEPPETIQLLRHQVKSKKEDLYISATSNSSDALTS